jgi:hypothetical protein
MTIYENGSTKKFAALDVAIENDVINNANSWTFYTKGGKPLQEALDKAGYVGADLSNIKTVKVDKGYYNKQGSNEQGEKMNLGEGFTMALEVPIQVPTADGKSTKTEYVRVEAFGIEPSGRAQNYFDEFEQYSLNAKNEAERINPNSPVVKNYYAAEDGKIDDRITSQLSSQVVTSSNEYSKIQTNKTLEDTGVEIRTKPVYDQRGGQNVVIGYDVVVNQGMPFEQVTRRLNTKSAVSNYINDMTNYIKVQAANK